MNFWHLVRVLQTRKWIIIGLVGMTLLVVVIAAPEPKVTYVATCQMSPTAQAMRGGITTTANTDNGGAQLPDRAVVLSNLVLLAQSGEVIQAAADFLALPETEQKKLHPGLPAYRRIPRLYYSRQPDKPIAPKDWMDVLQIAPMVNPAIGEKGTISDVIAINIKIANGEDAPFIANAIGVCFAESYDRKSHSEKQKYIEFLSASMDEAGKKLGDIENQIAEAKSRHGLVAVDADTAAAVQTLNSLTSTRDAAQATASEAAAALNAIDRQLASQPLVRTDRLPSDMNPEVIKLKQELAQAESDLRVASGKYTPEHSVYRAIQGKIGSLRTQIARSGSSYNLPVMNELHNILIKQRSETANQLAASAAKLRILNGQVVRAQATISTVPEAQKEIATFTRELTRVTEDYTTYAQKLALAKISDRESREAGSIILFDPAMKSIGPMVDGPRKRTLLVYGFILTLVLGTSICVWLDSIDNKMRNAADVEELLGLPAIGLIPAIEGSKGELTRLTHIFPLSAAAESYRILRTHVLFAHRDKPFKTLMAASSKPGQGATTTICNLAIALAQIGKKIVLIDADMRRPSLHEFFSVSNEVGLSTLLTGTGDTMDAIKQTEVENLIVIPAGPPPLNPSELLASHRMWEIVERLKENCDMVLFDTPSTVVFSDGPVLASWLDAVLFVVSANQAPRGTEMRALDILRKAKANIIGTAVNRLGFDTVDSCHFHSKYYASSMGDIQQLPQSTASGARKQLESANSKASTGQKPEQSDKTAEADNPFPD